MKNSYNENIEEDKQIDYDKEKIKKETEHEEFVANMKQSDYDRIPLELRLDVITNFINREYYSNVYNGTKKTLQWFCKKEYAKYCCNIMEDEVEGFWKKTILEDYFLDETKKEQLKQMQFELEEQVKQQNTIQSTKDKIDTILKP